MHPAKHQSSSIFVIGTKSCTVQVKQADALRYILMHKFGGLYLDMDVECFASVDSSLEGFTVVLQGTGHEGVTNAIMASAPNHGFWLEVLRQCRDRANDPDKQWPIAATGPIVVVDAFLEYFRSNVYCRTGYMGDHFEVSSPPPA